MVINKSIYIIFVFCSLFFSSSAKYVRKVVRLGEYMVMIKVPHDFYMTEAPYEEGKYVYFISSSGSSVFLHMGGLVKLPIVNRDNSEILRRKEKREFTEFGKRDSVYFRETLFPESKIRAGYDNVIDVDITKFEKIIKSIKIKKRRNYKTIK